MVKTKVINYYGTHALLTVDANIMGYKEDKAHFVITGTIWKATKAGKKDKRCNDCIACGCLHDEIIKAFPQLANLVALHGADMDGVPSYVVENGWYFIKLKDIKDVMKHFRVTEETAKSIIDTLTTKEEVEAYCQVMMPTWKKAADDVIAEHKLELLTY